MGSVTMRTGVDGAGDWGVNSLSDKSVGRYYNPGYLMNFSKLGELFNGMYPVFRPM
jgi:hypothetical protein